ncbi:MAG: hypothetical protein ACYSR8_06485 [Planctomycetota bacterium]|jgi:hypothetical protein
MVNITPEQQKRVDEITSKIHEFLDTRTKAEHITDDLKKLWEEIKSIENHQ